MVRASSVLRASLFRERGLHVATLENGPLRFPLMENCPSISRPQGSGARGLISTTCATLAMKCRNSRSNPLYYRENYANKPWLGIEGWEKRVAMQKTLPKPQPRFHHLRRSASQRQRGGNAVVGKSARLWSSFDAVTPNVETIEFLYALTRLVKPTNVLETRTWLGLSACAIGRALVENGLGHLTALERDPEAYAVAVHTITQYGLDTGDHNTSLLRSGLRARSQLRPRCFRLFRFNGTH